MAPSLASETWQRPNDASDKLYRNIRTWVRNTLYLRWTNGTETVWNINLLATSGLFTENLQLNVTVEMRSRISNLIVGQGLLRLAHARFKI